MSRGWLRIAPSLGGHTPTRPWRIVSRLEPELKSLADVRVSVWADSLIPLGDDWRREIVDGLVGATGP